MKYKRLVVLAVVLIVAVIIFISLRGEHAFKQSEQRDEEAFIQHYLLTKDGLIRTNFAHQDEGELYLSESSSLWLIYLALIGDESAFAHSYEQTAKHFQGKEKLFAWRIYGKEVAHTNALIDDLRIVRALYLMGETSGNDKWREKANEIANQIITYHTDDAGMLIDFYDWSHQMKAKQLTVSYLDLFTLKQMVSEAVISEDYYSRHEGFLAELPVENNWYPFDYDDLSGEYSFTSEVNLIDQLYIAIHKEEVGQNTDDFYGLIQDLYKRDQKLFGRYHAQTNEATVSYESVAVYALVSFYAQLKNDHHFAGEMIKKMQAFKVVDEQSKYDGGYVDLGSESTHSFDNLLALIAERINEYAADSKQ